MSLTQARSPAEPADAPSGRSPKARLSSRASSRNASNLARINSRQPAAGHEPAVSPAAQAAAWRSIVAPYLRPDGRRALLQLLSTAVPFLAIMAGLLIALSHGFLLGLLLVPLGAAFLVRLFMLQHDCGHGSFFPSRRANDLLGWVLGVVTLTPYTSWRGSHALHHAGTGNLDRRGVGDVTTLTLDEYRAMPKRQQWGYRLYRHPLVLFGIGPAWLFLIRQRYSTANPKPQLRDWSSIIGTNLGLLAILAVLGWTIGPLPLLLGWLPVTLLAAASGVWLFYVQHQFEDAYWESASQWDFRKAALEGASFYDLPQVLHWVTGNIGFHHIHHLASRIPNYFLQDCHKSSPLFDAVPRLTLLASFQCARLALWDSDRRKLISFKQARQLCA